MNLFLRFRRGPALVILPLLAVALSGAGRAEAAPNMSPYKPSGWADKIVVSKSAGTHSDDSPLAATDTLFVDWAALNSGSAISAQFFTELYVDGILRFTWFSNPPLENNFYVYVEDYELGSLTAGSHTLRIKADSTNALAESNESDNEYTKTITVGSTPGACTANSTTLCLNSNRFKVQTNWRVPSQSTSGAGTAVALTGDTGYFWFFSSSNIELVIKVLDGRGINGRFWVFYGALSDVEYTITVTDTQTGAVKTYFNPSGNLASVSDIQAFGFPGEVQTSAAAAQPGTAAAESERTSLIAAAAMRDLEEMAGFRTQSDSRLEAAQISAPCSPGATTLCLNSSRFKLTVNWRVPSQGTNGVGTAVPLSGGDTGYFWFFGSNNVELIIKVLDGRSFNNKYWVFYGALSDVEYTITATDTQTGAVKTYFNPSGTQASIADTTAFDPSTSPGDAGALVGTLEEVSVQARMDNENFPILIRPGAEAYNPELTQLIALGSSAVDRLLDEFRAPHTLFDDTPLCLFAYALERIGDARAVPVLTDWLEQNLFAEFVWAPDFVTHAIKVLSGQGGLNTQTYTYGIDEKIDAIAQARIGFAPLHAGAPAAPNDPFGVCPRKIIVTGINAAGQQESVTIGYKVYKRDLQEVIDAEPDAAEKARHEARRTSWRSVDETIYGGTAYVPVSGADVSVKSNCAGTVTENIMNRLATIKGFSLTLPQGQSNADEIVNLARKFGGEVAIGALDTTTVISHESSGGSSAHVEVPISSTSASALVYSKDNYGRLRQHNVDKSFFSQNAFGPVQRQYNARPWYLPGTSITTKFFRVDPNRIVSIAVDSSACACTPGSSGNIPVTMTQPSDTVTDLRVVRVEGRVEDPNVTSATMKVNGAAQSIAVEGGPYSALAVLRSGDNTIRIDVSNPEGLQGCAQRSIRSTTEQTTMSVTLTWNLASTDVDLYTTQPDGQTAWYGGSTTTNGGILDVDNTSGFGPENFFLSSAEGDSIPAGIYKIRVHYYRDHQRTEQTPTRVVAWKIVILLNEATESERQFIYTGNLSTDNSGNASPGSNGPDWATAREFSFP